MARRHFTKCYDRVRDFLPTTFSWLRCFIFFLFFIFGARRKLKVIKLARQPLTPIHPLLYFINITIHNIYFMININAKISTRVASILAKSSAGLSFGKKRVAVKPDL